MLEIFKKDKPSDLDKLINKAVLELNRHKQDSEEYGVCLSHLERLMKLKNEAKTRSISPDTIALICGNLLGILIIVGYERVHVISSRGMAFIRGGSRPV